MSIDPHRAIKELPEDKVLVQIGWYCDLGNTLRERNALCAHDAPCGPTYAMVDRKMVEK